MSANTMPGARLDHDLLASVVHWQPLALLSAKDGRTGSLFWKDLPRSRQHLLALR
jgi:hypothetical protein